MKRIFVMQRPYEVGKRFFIMFFFHYSLLYVPCIVTVAIFYQIGIKLGE